MRMPEIEIILVPILCMKNPILKVISKIKIIKNMAMYKKSAVTLISVVFDNYNIRGVERGR